MARCHHLILSGGQMILACSGGGTHPGGHTDEGGGGTPGGRQMPVLIGQGSADDGRNQGTDPAADRHGRTILPAGQLTAGVQYRRTSPLSVTPWLSMLAAAMCVKVPKTNALL